MRILCAALLLFAAACARPTPNSVALYLHNAERQIETPEQRAEVRRALKDMLDKSPAELQTIRYADYSGKANQWSALEVLRHYFVPDRPAGIDEQRFYEEVKAPEARIAIEKQWMAVQ